MDHSETFTPLLVFLLAGRQGLTLSWMRGFPLSLPSSVSSAARQLVLWVNGDDAPGGQVLWPGLLPHGVPSADQVSEDDVYLQEYQPQLKVWSRLTSNVIPTNCKIVHLFQEKIFNVALHARVMPQEIPRWGGPGNTPQQHPQGKDHQALLLPWVCPPGDEGCWVPCAFKGSEVSANVLSLSS